MLTARALIASAPALNVDLFARTRKKAGIRTRTRTNNKLQLCENGFGIGGAIVCCCRCSSLHCAPNMVAHWAVPRAISLVNACTRDRRSCRGRHTENIILIGNSGNIRADGCEADRSIARSLRMTARATNINNKRRRWLETKNTNQTSARETFCCRRVTYIANEM